MVVVYSLTASFTFARRFIPLLDSACRGEMKSKVLFQLLMLGGDEYGADKI